MNGAHKSPHGRSHDSKATPHNSPEWCGDIIEGKVGTCVGITTLEGVPGE